MYCQLIFTVDRKRSKFSTGEQGLSAVCSKKHNQYSPIEILEIILDPFISPKPVFRQKACALLKKENAFNNLS